jgi:hypothetical protein
MTERNEIIKSVPLEISSTIKPPVNNNRVVMNQIFSSIMKQLLESPQADSQPSGGFKHPALPDGTGQIINIGA